VEGNLYASRVRKGDIMSHKIDSISICSQRAVRLSPRSTSLFLISALFVLSLLLTPIIGCAAGNENTSDNTSTGYTIKVFLNDTQIASLSLDDLLNLPQVNINAADRDQEGPTLLSALALAGVQNFSQVTATGMTQGRIAVAEITLTRNEIDDEVILDITNRGTAKLCGPDIDFNNWIRDVDKLAVK
jgi:hypothetical protein